MKVNKWTRSDLVLSEHLLLRISGVRMDAGRTYWEKRPSKDSHAMPSTRRQGRGLLSLFARGMIVVGVCLTMSVKAAAAETPLPDGQAIAASTEAAMPTPAIDAGDTAWLLVSTGLVMLMIPGLAFFYGGLVRRKNILSVLMQCFIVLCLISLQWVFFGYSLAFGPDVKGLTGNLAWVGLKGIGQSPCADYSGTVPHVAFMMFQMMFAIITPALIVGAFAERMKFSAFCILAVLWATLVYDPIAHWVWGTGGILRNMGALDFAGGTVVHISAGMAALVSAIVLGKRLRYPDGMSPPHNLPFAVLGAALLWFGWFGFNAGSALTSGGLAANALAATHISAAAAGLAWVLLDWLKFGKPTTLGVITGAVAGLVAITPASGFVAPVNGVWIGMGASLLCYIFVTIIKPKFGYDDSLDAFGVHGIGGIWGALATGIWADKSINTAGTDGLFNGNPGLLLIQLKAVLVTVGYSLVATFVIVKVLDALVGLRVNEHEERVGLDLTQHREAGYTQIE